MLSIGITIMGIMGIGILIMVIFMTKMMILGIMITHEKKICSFRPNNFPSSLLPSLGILRTIGRSPPKKDKKTRHIC